MLLAKDFCLQNRLGILRPIRRGLVVLHELPCAAQQVAFEVVRLAGYNAGGVVVLIGFAAQIGLQDLRGSEAATGGFAIDGFLEAEFRVTGC